MKDRLNSFCFIFSGLSLDSFLIRDFQYFRHFGNRLNSSSRRPSERQCQTWRETRFWSCFRTKSISRELKAQLKNCKMTVPSRKLSFASFKQASRILVKNWPNFSSLDLKHWRENNQRNNVLEELFLI